MFLASCENIDTDIIFIITKYSTEVELVNDQWRLHIGTYSLYRHLGL